MVLCDRDDVESAYPGITSGLTDEQVNALCQLAAETVYHFILAPVTEEHNETIKRAVTLQVVSLIQVGDLQLFGIGEGREIRMNEERLIVGSHLCYGAKIILFAEGLTTPWGV